MPTVPAPAVADESHAGRAAAKTAKPRRRVGFRKGADVDEEMWPTEAFGGVTDEQFWDDLASDKPLTTTARTAQQDSGARNRPLNAPPPAATQPVQALGDNRARGEGRRGAGSAGYPESRTGPNPAAERTAIQPTYTPTRPAQSMAPQALSAPQPVQAPSGPSQPVSAAGQTASAASQPAYTATQPSEARGRRRARSSDDEDPLTSAAFSLRSSGPVDGRSALRASEPRTGGTAPYAYSGTPYGDPSPVNQSTVTTPPYGESYGYRAPAAPVAQAADPRRPDGTRSHARHGGHGEGSRAARQPYPQDGYQGTGYQGTVYQTGGHPASGYPAGGYPGSGYPGNGHRAPYDPRDDYRRLTHQR